MLARVWNFLRACCKMKGKQFADKLPIRDSLTYKLKRSGRGKPAVEGFTGDDLHRKSGRWMHKVQIVDRENDRYFKKVVDPATGEVVRTCEERLSEHQGYGSAKGRKPPSA